MSRMHRALSIVIALCAAVLVSCTGSPAQRSTGEYVDDAVITTKVKTALVQADDVDALDIDVDSFKGVVYLNGFVGSQAEADRAEQVASGVKGVDRVANKMEVKTTE